MEQAARRTVAEEQSPCPEGPFTSDPISSYESRLKVPPSSNSATGQEAAFQHMGDAEDPQYQLRLLPLGFLQPPEVETNPILHS